MDHPLLEYAKKHDKATLASTTFKRVCDTYNLQDKKVLDIGCGVGCHMQRFGPSSIGLTTDPKEVSLGKIINRDIRLGNVEQLDTVFPNGEKFDAIWCNNILEHLLSPHAFLVNLKKYTHKDTLLILGTPMIPYPHFLLRLKKFRGALATPHTNFFTKRTYELTVAFAGWKTLRISPFFFSSHFLNTLVSHCVPGLYIIAKNDTEYRYPPKKLKEWEFDPYYQPLIKIMNPDHQFTDESIYYK